VIGFFVALAIAASAADDGPFASLPHKLPSKAEARAAVLRCRLPAKSVSVQYEPDMQEDLVWVSRPSGPLSSQKLSCIADASLQTSYYVYFRDAAVQKRYDVIYDALEDKTETARARNWLRAHHRLADLPLPQKGKPLRLYTEAVEAFCGIKRGSLLAVADEHFITFTKDGLGEVSPHGIEHAAANEAQFECVMNAMSAADLKAYGLGFGFFGNAARSPSK
jgi:hypothetical protein